MTTAPPRNRPNRWALVAKFNFATCRLRTLRRGFTCNLLRAMRCNFPSRSCNYCTKIAARYMQWIAHETAALGGPCQFDDYPVFAVNAEQSRMFWLHRLSMLRPFKPDDNRPSCYAMFRFRPYTVVLFLQRPCTFILRSGVSMGGLGRAMPPEFRLAPRLAPTLHVQTGFKTCLL